MRVLRLLTRANVGGPAQQAISLWHAHKQLGLRTLLVVGRCDHGEASFDLKELGIPEMTPAEIQRTGPKSEGFVVLPQLRRRPSPLQDPPAFRAICRILRAYRPQVLHSHTSKAGYLGRRAAVAENVPVVAHTFHGHVLRSYFWRPIADLLRHVEKRLAPRSSLLFAVSPSCARELEELDVAPPGRIRVIPPAVATEPFTRTDRAAARSALQVPDDQWLVVSVGRLVNIKRVDLFLQALSHPDVYGHVYGAGPLASQLKLQASRNGTMMGLVHDLPSRLAAYDALVISSEREGCPLVGIEAFAAGVPVVGFDVPGVQDLLGPWGGGLLVPRERGSEGLADALQRLREEPGLRRAITAAGREGLHRFAPETVARQLADAYEGVL